MPIRVQWFWVAQAMLIISPHGNQIASSGFNVFPGVTILETSPFAHGWPSFFYPTADMHLQSGQTPGNFMHSRGLLAYWEAHLPLGKDMTNETLKGLEMNLNMNISYLVGVVEEKIKQGLAKRPTELTAEDVGQRSVHSWLPPHYMASFNASKCPSVSSPDTFPSILAWYNKLLPLENDELQPDVHCDAFYRKKVGHQWDRGGSDHTGCVM